ncbi:site-specific DNA-methyltransferase (Type III DNA modification enzyme) [Vibrio diabolicus E0666]|uniref:site-specific DNA-methyltransferase n=1 Tax=Vibrio diabolicus TaxID=50719 RepID=UPI0002B70AD3|nr:site-specific DNA-methyltransferase [Vibrio diabolicus]EMD80180.1 site-specific DNA-methyltransferase (Type III DNA modification enzyme) [Vibrio diabolicus E0666]
MSEMEKITGSSPEAKSLDITNQNIEQLKQLFPDVFSEGKIDFEALRAVLGEEVDDSEERYNFTWNGKTKARQIAQTPSTGTLRPCKDESVNWDTTENLFIEGDNLEVLKLLQKSYHKKVKMIYIDPPYNTGKDFVYKDNFHDNLSNYLELTGQIDSDGNKLNTNTETSGRFHSDWLNMLYPRLKLARNLLKDDGAIFISIGVEELSNLKHIMNEIFGEDNFVEIFSWVKTSTPPALSTKSRKTNEYIICYEKNKNSIKYNGESLDGGDQPLLNSGNTPRKLKFPKDKITFNTNKFKDGIYSPSKPDRVELINEIKIIDGKPQSDVEMFGEFKWTQEFLEQEVLKGTTFVVKSDKLSVRFLRQEEGFKRPTNFIKEAIHTPVISKPLQGVETNEKASTYLKELLGGDYFDYPKPVSLISYLIGFMTNEDDIILDFFGGSGTTAEAVLKKNTDDKQNRKFILVQLPEPVSDVKSKEFLKSNNKELYISKLTQLRLETLSQNYPAKDFGFKTFSLDETNIRPWDADFENLELVLQQAEKSIKADRSSEDVLYEIFLKYGYDLTTPVETEVVNGKNVFVVGAGALFVCLDDDITTETVEGIVKLKEDYDPEDDAIQVVFKDEGFADDRVKTNAFQILKQADIEDVKSI